MNMRTVLASTASLLASALAGCADPPLLYGDHPASTSGTTMPPVTAPDLWMDVYPSGPYGNQTGDVMFDIELEGYRLSPANNDSTTLDWQDEDHKISLSSVRSEHPNAKCIWLSIGAFW